MKNKGISLIILIISIVVIVIMASIVIPTGIEKINSTRVASFNNDIVNLKQEVDTYMLANNLQYPVRVDANGNYIIYMINSSPELVQQVTKKGDQADTFYILDLDKLGADNYELGAGKTIDDYFIVSKTSRNIYYAKGIIIDDKTYYTKIDKGDGIIVVQPTSIATITSTPIPAGTNTPIPTPSNTPTPTNTPVPTPSNTPVPTPSNTPIPTPTNTPMPTATNTPVPTATNTPIPTAPNTPTLTPVALQLQNVSAPMITALGASVIAGGEVKGLTIGSTITVRCTYTDFWSDYYGDPEIEGTTAVITCNGAWQNFTVRTGRLGIASTWYIHIWAEDSLGNRTPTEVCTVEME